MKPGREHPTSEPTWHCVLDRQGRLIYLDTDLAKATEFAVPGTILKSAPRMGDAMKLAAKALGAARRQRE